MMGMSLISLMNEMSKTHRNDVTLLRLITYDNLEHLVSEVAVVGLNPEICFQRLLSLLSCHIASTAPIKHTHTHTHTHRHTHREYVVKSGTF
jgi:hypothetical protein